MAPGVGGGQPSWAQQVHRLAGDEDGPVTPWKPPVEDVFQAAARRQSAARPAGLGRRLVARLIDTVVLGAVTAAAAVPLGTKAADHIDGKIDAAKLSGRTETVWLLDGTTALYLGIVLAVLLLFGVLYEALPTARGPHPRQEAVRDRGARHREPPAARLRRGAAPLAGVQRHGAARHRRRRRRLVPVRPALASVLARQGRTYVRSGIGAYSVRGT